MRSKYKNMNHEINFDLFQPIQRAQFSYALTVVVIILLYV